MGVRAPGRVHRVCARGPARPPHAARHWARAVPAVDPGSHSSARAVPRYRALAVRAFASGWDWSAKPCCAPRRRTRSSTNGGARRRRSCIAWCGNIWRRSLQSSCARNQISGPLLDLALLLSVSRGERWHRQCRGAPRQGLAAHPNQSPCGPRLGGPAPIDAGFRPSACSAYSGCTAERGLFLALRQALKSGSGRRTAARTAPRARPGAPTNPDSDDIE